MLNRKFQSTKEKGWKMKAINTKRRMLDVGIITKNEVENLEKCLQCLQPLREALDCKIIVADTGSTDNNIEVAQQYADEVFSIEWTNDFAEARNKVLDRSNAQWFLTVDTDEFLQDPTELINFFQSGEYKKYRAAFIIQANAVYYDASPNKERIEEQEVPRLFYAGDGARYEGAVHECVQAQVPVIRLFNTKLLHYGYYYKKTPEDQKRKEDRNRRNSTIIEKMLEEEPENLRLLSLAIDSGVGDEKKCEIADMAWNLLQRKEEAWKDDFAGPAMVRAAKMYTVMGRYKDCIKVSERFKEHLPNSILLCDVWFFRIFSEQRMKKDYQTLLAHFFEYIKYKNYTIADQRNSLEWIYTAATEYKNLSVVGLATMLCEKLYSEIAEDSTEEEKEKFQKDLDSILVEIKFEDISVESLKNWFAIALKLQQKHLDTSKILQGCFTYKENPEYQEAFERFWIHVFYYQPQYVIKNVVRMNLDDSWMAICCKLMASDATDENKIIFNNMVDAVEQWAENKQVCMLYAISVRHNWKLPDAAFCLRPPLMSDAIESAFLRVVTSQLENVNIGYDYLTTNSFTDSMNKRRWAIFLLRSIFQSKCLEELKQDERMLKLCVLYKQLANQYWKHMMFIENLTEEELLAAPAEFVADYYFIQAMEAVENKDWIEAMKRMKSALEQGVILKNIVVALSDYVEKQVENQQQEQVQVSDEMYQLAEQMKVQIKNLVAWGETEQAKKALQQLITFCPNDEEAKSLLWVLGAE